MNWRLCIRAATATACAAAMAYAIWRVEWFDVFRWGVPDLDLLAVYACYIGGAAAVGWGLAAGVTSRSLWN